MSTPTHQLEDSSVESSANRAECFMSHDDRGRLRCLVRSLSFALALFSAVSCGTDNTETLGDPSPPRYGVSNRNLAIAWAIADYILGDCSRFKLFLPSDAKERDAMADMLDSAERDGRVCAWSTAEFSVDINLDILDIDDCDEEGGTLRCGLLVSPRCVVLLGPQGREINLDTLLQRACPLWIQIDPYRTVGTFRPWGDLGHLMTVDLTLE